jgi:hypothetical protein
MGTYRLTLNSNRLAIILEPSNNDCDHKSLIISHQALTSSVRHWVAGFPVLLHEEIIKEFTEGINLLEAQHQMVLNFRHDDPAHPNATSKDYSLWNGRFGFP